MGAPSTVTSRYSRLAVDRTRIQDFFVGIAPLLLGFELLVWMFFLPSALRGHTSFRQLYSAAFMVRTGHSHELYDYDAQKRFQDQTVSAEPIVMPFIRPPFDTLIFIPFSVLSYKSAYAAFLVLNLALISVSAWLLWPWTENWRVGRNWLPPVVFASYTPVVSALMLGQDSILLLAILSSSLVLFVKERDLTAGLVAGLGLFKFHLLIPFAVLLLLWRRWRFFTGFIVTAIGLASISLALVGSQQLRVYSSSLFAIAAASKSAHALLRYPLPITMMPNLHGLIFGLAGSSWSIATRNLATLMAILATMILTAITVPKTCVARDAFVVAMTASVAMSYYLFVYDLTLLLLPLTMFLNHATAWAEILPSSVLFIAPACLFLFPSYFYLVSLPLLLFLIVVIRDARQNCFRHGEG
jgi:hypothetical protein